MFLKKLSTDDQRSRILLIAIAMLMTFTGQSYAQNQKAGGNMQTRLAKLIEMAAYPRNPLLSEQAIPFWKNRIEGATNPAERIEYHAELAFSYINLGDNESALETLDELEEELMAFLESGGKHSIDLYGLNFYRGLALFRESELKNCCSPKRNDQSCIFPFDPAAIHKGGNSARKSRDIYLKLVKENPSDFRSIWMLNIVQSALGDPIADLPKYAQLDMSHYDAPVEFPVFENVGEASGVATPGLAGGSSMEDFNNDGWLDILTSSSGLKDPLTLFLNRGDGTFMETDAGLSGLTGGINTTQCDYNNDGWIDVMVLRGGWMQGYGEYPNSLLRNNGDGTFTDVTIKAGMYHLAPTHTAIWADFNKDGWQDCFVANESADSTEHYSCKFYLNKKDGTFVECAAKVGLDIEDFVKSASVLDYDNDGWPDLYLSNAETPNILMRNEGLLPNGMPKFTDVTASAGVAEPDYSFTVVAADFNQDGWEDLFVSSYAPTYTNEHLAMEYVGKVEPINYPRVYINNQQGAFEEQSKAFGMRRTVDAMGLASGDINSDGYPDLYVGTGNPSFSALYPNLLFLNQKGEYFSDVSAASRTGHLQKGHGISIGDVDNDGDNDIFINVGGFYISDIGYKALFINPMDSLAYVGIRLQGCTSDRSAAGARVSVDVQNGSEVRTVYATITTGDGFGASPYQKIIGLAGAERILKVDVRWPATDKVQTFTGLEPGRRYILSECEENAIPAASGNISR